MTRLFKIIAIAEGVSAIALFFVAMPMKYIWDNDEYIRPVGMAHGLLWTVYMLIATMLKFELRWSWKKFAVVCLASIPPGGTFFIHDKYINENNTGESAN